MLPLTRQALKSRNILRPVSRRYTHSKQGWLYVDSVFPIKLGVWDLRSYIGLFRQEALLATLQARLSNVQEHGFKVLSLEPHEKDGGVFVQFEYDPSIDRALESSSGAQDLDIPPPEAKEAHASRVLDEIEQLVRDEVDRDGGIPTWLGIPGRGSVWLVKGTPWREDMNRFPFPILRISYDGPDVPEQSLYKLLRPYGRIQDLVMPTPVPAGTLRSTTVTFTRLRSATVAKNVMHGLDVSLSPAGDSSSGKITRLRTAYQKPIRAHAVFDWMGSHPKIVVPVIVFLLGSLTYTIFDPIRSFMVQGHISDWFDYREYKLYKWIVSNTYDKLPGTLSSRSPPSNSSNSSPSSVAGGLSSDGESGQGNPDNSESLSSSDEDKGVWKERREAESAVRAYLNDIPSTVAFIHGPQGSGKTRMLQAVLEETNRKVLYVDCRELQQAGSNAQLVAALAKQTGYWPIFTFFDSMSNLIDLASVGLIGQKAGLSTSLPEQLHQVLTVVTGALQSVSKSHLHAVDVERQREAMKAEQRKEAVITSERVRRGTWHDGRVDCVAGNGVMSELGIGDEEMGPWEAEPAPLSTNGLGEKGIEHGESRTQSSKEQSERQDEDRKQLSAADAQTLAALPIVVIRNYEASNKAGSGTRREDLLTVLAQWSASLTENSTAHVIVISDNRENSKRLAKAIPSKPLSSIALSDADASSALSFVKQKLRDGGIKLRWTRNETDFVDRLGGRASDLESLIHKVRNGQSVEEAVEDIIYRGVGELRKSAFGDDVDDAKGLGWTREQAWVVLKQLAKQAELPYHEILLEFPFKGDEAPLKNMEHAELIAIATINGRPSTIKPGKPVYKYVFERLVKDAVFQATQDIGYNEKVIAAAESTIKACEAELITLESIRGAERLSESWLEWSFGWLLGSRASDARARYLLGKMGTAEKKIETLEWKNSELKKALALKRTG